MSRTIATTTSTTTTTFHKYPLRQITTRQSTIGILQQSHPLSIAILICSEKLYAVLERAFHCISAYYRLIVAIIMKTSHWRRRLCLRRCRPTFVESWNYFHFENLHFVAFEVSSMCAGQEEMKFKLLLFPKTTTMTTTTTTTTTIHWESRM